MKSLRFLSHALLVLGSGMASAVSINAPATSSAPPMRTVELTLEATPIVPLETPVPAPSLLIPIRARRRGLKKIADNMGLDYFRTSMFHRVTAPRYNRRQHRIRRNGWA